MTLSKADLPGRIVTERTVVRRAAAEDLPKLAAWPGYGGLDGGFDMTCQQSRSADGRFWWAKIDEPDRCHYCVIERETKELLGLLALVQIDWAKAVVGNMGIRIRADKCNQGYGSESLRALLTAVLAAGFRKIRLDVAATNGCAIACYRKSGMRISGEFWQQHEGPPPNPADPAWAPLMPHFRPEDGKWMVRFHWMET